MPSFILWLSLMIPLVAWGAEHPPAMVTVALCPDVATCAEELGWLHSQGSGDESILLADALLEANVGGWQDGESLEAQLQEGLVRAREAVAQQRWAQAEAALDDTAEALQAMDARVENDDLFTLFYLRGAVRQARGGGEAESFRQAAALAWNRTTAPLVPYEGGERVVEAYYLAMAKLLEEGVGELALQCPLSAAIIHLDGVELGTGPLVVRAFPGRHRITAQEPGTERRMVREVWVRADQLTTVELRLDRTGDAVWLHEQLALALTSHRMDPALGDLLADWATRQGVRQIRLARAQRIGGPASTPLTVGTPTDLPDSGEIRYRLEQAAYDPLRRSFER